MYSLLNETRVVEISLLAPDSVGQHLADLGAEVIKVEGPPQGDYVREIGELFIDDVSLLHLRWNRGKKSVWLDLKTEEGLEMLLQLVERSDVLIDGMRWGALERLGLSFERLKEHNPALVYCSISGLGTFGPYARLGTHGVFFDSYAGLAPPVYPTEDGIPRIPNSYTAVGMEASGLYAAMAILAALSSARRTGDGVFVEVAESDTAALWSASMANAALNNISARSGRGMEASVRYSYYETGDDRYIIFQATEAKFWKNFCHAIDRRDLEERFPSQPVGDRAYGNDELRRELRDIFRERTQAEWVQLFMDANVAGGPVHTGAGFLEDPHFKARDHVYAGTVGSTDAKFVGTPVKVSGERFTSTPAPRIGEQTRQILANVLGKEEAEIQDYLSRYSILE